MSPEDKRNMGHSVFQRLLNLARENRQDFNLLLLRYGMERFLYRLSISGHAERFVLKGASMFLVWKGQNYRVTRDADFLGLGSQDLEAIARGFKEICEIDRESEDGMAYAPTTLNTEAIRETQDYGGVRITLSGRLYQARIPLQIDIGFGDAITPDSDSIVYPTLLGAPPPKLRGYPKYTVVAEKLETLVRLGLANSRMKDFYDLWLLSRLFGFEGGVLCEAIRNTFSRRKTMLPPHIPFAFTEAFSLDAKKTVQWRAFVRNAKPAESPEDLHSAIKQIALLLVTPLEFLQDTKPLKMKWMPDTGWK